MAEYSYTEIESIELPGHAVKGAVQSTVQIKITHNDDLVYEGKVKVIRHSLGDFPEITSITPEIISQSTLNRVVTDLKKLSSILAGNS